MDCSDWSAWYNRMPGSDDPNLYVSGRCSVSSGSTTLSLKPGDEGIVDEPDLYVLQLVVEEPEIGDTQHIDREVRWSDDVGAGIRRVRVQGGASAHIEVIDAT